MCRAEIENTPGLSIDDCVLARDYCQTIMQRYITLLDNATYMPCEHIQKEKEYGIKWRTTFKLELEKTYDKLVMKLFIIIITK